MQTQFAPAAERNKEPIAEVLGEILAESLPNVGEVSDKTKTALEVASGSGQHIVHFANRFPDVCWQPSDLSSQAVASVNSRVREAGLVNIKPCLQIKADSDGWPAGPFDLILNINMIHIAPWSACEGLFRRGACLLSRNGALVLYGPFQTNDPPTAVSNLAFDQSLRERDPSWGVRHLEEVNDLAQSNELHIQKKILMPANNLILVFRRKINKV